MDIQIQFARACAVEMATLLTILLVSACRQEAISF